MQAVRFAVSPLLTAAAAPTVGVVRQVGADQLSAPTPCSDWTVRQLVNHQLSGALALGSVARKEQVPPPAESTADLIGDDWAARLEEEIDRLVAAWSEPSAWEGTVSLGGNERPAAVVGGVVLTELVLHGWDLARATGLDAEWSDDVLEFVRGDLAKRIEQGRQHRMFGPEVALPAGASDLDKLLGLSGRDPNWTPRPRNATPRQS
ncbi:TIGR03086 family metal-binding protein [Streptomyces sp. NPDC090499]|uniref:TIGR03086 family metal-binding protein n=1 Tax=Streptomyces sp. NPDC090499 TaxID=3365965 RepID=UPI003816EB1B